MAPSHVARATSVAASWSGTSLPARVSEAIQPSRGLAALAAAELAQQPHDRVEVVGHPLLHRNDAVVGDVDVLRAYLSAALRDVAEADARLRAHELGAVDRV